MSDTQRAIDASTDKEFTRRQLAKFDPKRKLTKRECRLLLLGRTFTEVQ